MKNLLSVGTLILFSVVGSVRPAFAWASHEHPFDPATGVELRKLGQDGAN